MICHSRKDRLIQRASGSDRDTLVHSETWVSGTFTLCHSCPGQPLIERHIFFSQGAWWEVSNRCDNSVLISPYDNSYLGRTLVASICKDDIELTRHLLTPRFSHEGRDLFLALYHAYHSKTLQGFKLLLDYGAPLVFRSIAFHCDSPLMEDSTHNVMKYMASDAEKVEAAMKKEMTSHTCVDVATLIRHYMRIPY